MSNDENISQEIIIYIYIYIFGNPQTDPFVVSQLFSMAGHAGHIKLGFPNYLFCFSDKVTLLKLHVIISLSRHADSKDSFVTFCWWAKTSVSMCRSPLENITFVFTSSTESSMFFHLTLMVCVMGGNFSYSSHFVGCYFQDLFKTARSTLELSPFILFPCRFVKVQMVQLYHSTDTATAWMNSCFILSQISDFPLIDNNCSPCFTFVYADIVFSWWDIANEVYELVNEFQRLAIEWGDGIILIKIHQFWFI